MPYSERAAATADDDDADSSLNTSLEELSKRVPDIDGDSLPDIDRVSIPVIDTLSVSGRVSLIGISGTGYDIEVSGMEMTDGMTNSTPLFLITHSILFVLRRSRMTLYEKMRYVLPIRS